MSRKKVSTTIYVTPEQADRLKLLHERTKVPVAVYIREGIDMMLKHYEHVLPGQMSLEAASLSPAPPPVAVSRRAVPDAQVPPAVTMGASPPNPEPGRSHVPPVTLRAGHAGGHPQAPGGEGSPAPRVAAAGQPEPPTAVAAPKPSRPGPGDAG